MEAEPEPLGALECGRWKYPVQHYYNELIRAAEEARAYLELEQTSAHPTEGRRKIAARLTELLGLFDISTEGIVPNTERFGKYVERYWTLSPGHEEDHKR